MSEQILSFAEALRRKARALMECGNLKEALRICKTALKVESDSVVGWFTKGVLHINCEEYRKAVFAFQQVKKIRQEEPGVWHNLGLCYYELGYPKAAIRYFRRAIEIIIREKLLGRGNTFSSLVEIYWEQGMLTDALLVLDRWLKLEPKNEEVFFMRETVLRETGIAPLRARMATYREKVTEEAPRHA